MVRVVVGPLRRTKVRAGFQGCPELLWLFMMARERQATTTGNAPGLPARRKLRAQISKGHLGGNKNSVLFLSIPWKAEVRRKTPLFPYSRRIRIPPSPPAFYFPFTTIRTTSRGAKPLSMAKLAATPFRARRVCSHPWPCRRRSSWLGCRHGA